MLCENESLFTYEWLYVYVRKSKQITPVRYTFCEKLKLIYYVPPSNINEVAEENTFLIKKKNFHQFCSHVEKYLHNTTFKFLFFTCM